MEFSPEQRDEQERVSIHARKFLDFVEQRPQLLEMGTFAGLMRSAGDLVPTLSGVDAGGDYGLQPWPVLIDSARRREFERAGVALGRLVRDLPRRFFGNDPERVAEFYGFESEVMAALLLSEPSFVGETIGRGDFIDTAGGLKCIEFNFGSLGGWQHCVYAPLYLDHPEIRAFAAAHGLGLDYRHSIRALMRHVVRDSLRRSPPGRRELNLLVVASDGGNTSVDTHPEEVYRREYAQVLQQMGRGGRGRLRVARVSDLEFEDNRLLVDGTRYHSVVEQSDSEPSREIFRSIKAGEVYCYTGLIGLLTGDKRNLAFLSENQDSPRFTPDERRLIARYVPWTRHLRDEPAEFRGDRRPLPEILERHRPELVIKAGHGFAGYDVHVGRFVDPETWSERVGETLEEGGWIVQEYLEALPQTYQLGDSGAGPYDVNWGLYVFGDSYGGTFFRMAPRGSTPILNISQGARIGVVFEARAA